MFGVYLTLKGSTEEDTKMFF